LHSERNKAGVAVAVAVEAGSNRSLRPSRRMLKMKRHVLAQFPA
jgi:hypothetical protein